MLADVIKPKNFLEGNKDKKLGWTLSFSAASFLMTRRNSHYLSAEEKVTRKMVVGCLSALHLSIFFLLLSAILTHSQLLQTEEDRDSVIR